MMKRVKRSRESTLHSWINCMDSNSLLEWKGNHSVKAVGRLVDAREPSATTVAARIFRGGAQQVRRQRHGAKDQGA